MELGPNDIDYLSTYCQGRPKRVQETNTIVGHILFLTAFIRIAKRQPYKHKIIQVYSCYSKWPTTLHNSHSHPV